MYVGTQRLLLRLFVFTVHAISSNDYISILASFNLWQESRIKIPSCHKGKDDTSLMSTDQTLGVFFFFFFFFFKILTIGPGHVSEKGNVTMHFCTACLLNLISLLQFQLSLVFFFQVLFPDAQVSVITLHLISIMAAFIL